MKSVLHDNEIPETSQWAYVPLLLFFIAAFFSKFLVSISVGLMAVALLVFQRRRLQQLLVAHKRLLSGFALLFVLVLFDGIRASGDWSSWGKELLLKLPFLIVPLYALSLDGKSCRFEKVMVSFVGLTAGVGLVSIVNYFIHFDQINELLLQSKHIPIFGKIHHIYYGVIVALNIWIAMYFAFKGSYKRVWMTLVVLLLVLLHLLASRTGLIAFYASLVAFGFFYGLRFKKWKAFVVVLALVVALPAISTLLSTSFRNKVLNSQEDLKAITSEADLNYKSLGMRFEAWKTTFDVIKTHPIVGVGAHRLDQAMQRQYVENKTSLFKENRIGPHSQWLETTASHGVFGFVVLMLLFIWIFSFAKSSPLALAIFTLLLATMCFESFLERQMGIVIFALYVMVFVTKLLPNRVSENKLD